MLNLFFNILFCNMNISVIVDILAVVTSSFLSIVAIFVSIKTLKQSSDALVENSRANIVFYVYTLTGGQQFLTIKNFGNSVGEILDIDISPKLDYSKSPRLNKASPPVITNYKNIFLAPNQCIKSWFPFSDYPDKKFVVTVTYKTLGKLYTESYPIDLSYIEAIDYLRKSSFHSGDIRDVLVDINNTLQGFSEKF